MRIEALAAGPFVLPVSCVTFACACEGFCPGAGAAACIGIAALAAAALFVPLSAVAELQSLGAIRD